MFQAGFLGTKAPFFMDFVTMIVALLPLLVGIAISFARNKNYKWHYVSQIAIFVISVLIVGYFEYGIRLGGGYEAFVKNTHVSHDYLFVVLMIHIVISVLTLGIWASTIFRAKSDSSQGGLPGNYSTSHKKSGIRSFIGIGLTSLTGIWVYLLLFVF
jgi:putative membrane protein